MNQVWFLFKILQLLSGSSCLYIHIVGSLTAEPLPHNLLFCGTFGTFMVLAVVHLTKLYLGGRTLLYPCMLLNLAGTVMHYICALVSMHYAERDFHLQFMDNVEERNHLFFRFCRKLSSASIIAGSLHLLQCILLLDLIVKVPAYEDLKPIKIVTEPPERDDKFQAISNEEGDLLARKIADIYFLGADVDYWLRVRSKWFRQLAGGQELNSLYDPTPSTSSTTQSDDDQYEFQTISATNVPDEQAEKIENPFENVQSIRDLTQSGESVTDRKRDGQAYGSTVIRDRSDPGLPHNMENMSKAVSIMDASIMKERKATAKAGDKAARKEEDKTEDKAHKKTDDKTEDKADKKTDDKTEDKADKKTDDKTEDKADKKTDDKTEDKADKKTDDKTEDKADKKTDDKTDDERDDKKDKA